MQPKSASSVTSAIKSGCLAVAVNKIAACTTTRELCSALQKALDLLFTQRTTADDFVQSGGAAALNNVLVRLATSLRSHRLTTSLVEGCSQASWFLRAADLRGCSSLLL